MSFRWQPGRQGTGYRKLLVAHGLWLGPLVLFRPDVMQQGVTKVSRRRVVLSFGVAVR